MHKILIALGTNINHEHNMRNLKMHIMERFQNVRFSQNMLTDAIGEKFSGKVFLNSVAMCLTEKDSPYEVETLLKEIETLCGNSNKLRESGKITSDLDLLLFDNQKFHTNDWCRLYIKTLVAQLVDIETK